ncbi:hypothetical protein AMAG_19602 [Allomyces macrogynus ATCC 38327]|uniref:Chromatin modification-related protein n=1 Tax=Allomyces macrogynus (strain ATCC 38327) TaxID=578462 RepID=A0A0L0SVK7_ALLM3|nr:hypothetical protein AMAG_19602 [Allomyces macrogynus ATCC 38327]|eukprot:KNE66618.1 hypothetical protein AMAG_19602 [Allomyces macrogynus ATCC 38327]
MIFIEDYIDTVESLSPNLQRLVSNLRELDAVVYHTHASLVADIRRFCATVTTLSPAARARELASIDERLRKCLPIDENRALIAMAAKDLVDVHVQRVNDNYNAFCLELSSEEAKIEQRKRAAEAAAQGADVNVVDASPTKKRARRDDSVTATPQASQKSTDESTAPPPTTKGRRGQSTAAAAAAAAHASTPEPSPAPPTATTARQRAAAAARPSASTTGTGRRKAAAAAAAAVAADADDRDASPATNARGGSAAAGAASSTRSPPVAIAGEEAAVPLDDGMDDGDEEYCYCRKGTWVGDMVGCDDDLCKYEWFHLQCVGLKKAPPDGDPWICPDCIDRRRKEALAEEAKQRGPRGRRRAQ